MIFDIPVSELWLNNEDFDGYNTIEYEIGEKEIKREIMRLISKEYGEKAYMFVKDFDVLESDSLLDCLKEYYEVELNEYAQEKYNSEN